MHRRGSTSPTAFCRWLIRREKRSWISANSFTTRLRDRSIKPTLIFRTSPAVDCPLRNTDKCKRKILWNLEKKVSDLEHPLYKFVRDFFKISILRSMLLSEHIPTPICHHLFICSAPSADARYHPYTVSGQTRISSVKYLRQHRMIHADCGASAVGYAALP